MFRVHYLWITIVPLIFLTNLRHLGSLGTFRYVIRYAYVCVPTLGARCIIIAFLHNLLMDSPYLWFCGLI